MKIFIELSKYLLTFNNYTHIYPVLKRIFKMFYMLNQYPLVNSIRPFIMNVGSKEMCFSPSSQIQNQYDEMKFTGRIENKLKTSLKNPNHKKSPKSFELCTGSYNG